MTGDFVTVVSGLPRSGTSMMMKMLAAGGIPALTDGHRRADPDNPLGYFELEVVKQLPSNVDWLKEANGHAVKVVSALIEKLPRDHNYRIIFMQRDLTEILASQRRMLERRGEYIDHSRDNAMGPMFEKHIASTLERARARKEIRLLPMRHSNVHADPLKAIAAIEEFLSCALDREAMVAAIDPELWRQRV
jgi:hypothetical protein